MNIDDCRAASRLTDSADACSTPLQWHNSRASQNLGGVVERLMAPVLKTGRAKVLVGSNPTPSAISKHFRSSVNSSCHFSIRARRFERSSTGGERYAPRLKSRRCGIILQSQSAALDNP